MTGPTRSARGEAAAAGVGLLVVCTANVCRSPVAAALLASRLAEAGVVVTSAGTRALDGEPVDPPMAALLETAGLPVGRTAARQLRPDLARGAALVLTMTREHRSAVVREAPAAVRRTFLLTEAARIAESLAATGWPAEAGTDPGSRLAAIPSLAAPHRAAAAAAEEVPDPYRRSAADYWASYALIADTVDRLVRAVG
ncbi:low molecular weight phosphatase family protein [Blastococcus sp. TF02A-26]|uniref:arsenate reductase/protein-tyrosine-phosphatase family protein n=1 Tax=Blastococcus sp. TF02A-26 TaxID=2250577 RepID=UPI000DEA26FB|nr:low molecular weight phosphatase family protein [Blastococcus sp. TF02A-26]RBY86137.1 low molecular weight phosphatase family protein [Blastococcus sp. TF02A-26]